MLQNRTVQIIYQTIYCTLGVVGGVACLGIFDNIDMIRWDFYVHFTNISNFLCLGVMFTALIQTARKKEDGYVMAVPLLKFIGMPGILLTFFVFNILLAKAADRDPQLSWRIGTVCFHIVLPIMYTADWFLFYERGKMKYYYPVCAVFFPLAYVVFIFIQAAILRFDTSILMPGTETPLIYPYFFINPETQGVAGVVKWIMILFFAFIVGGYVLAGIDKICKKAANKSICK